MILRNRKTLVGVSVMFVLLSACTSMSGNNIISKNDDFYVTSSFKSAKVQEAVRETANKRVLFVFDIDNTVLMNPDGQFLGSAHWYDWQKGLADSAAGKVKCRLEMHGAAFYIAHLVPTEGGYATSFIRDLQNSGNDVIALTARNPEFRYPTERELLRNEIDFSGSTPENFAGFPGVYLPNRSSEIPKPRNASYQNGIVMLAEQHKGAGLIDILRRIGAENSYDTVVFFDDSKENTDAMMDSFTKDHRRVIVFHYTAVNTDLEQYDLKKVIRVQDAIASAYAQFVQVPGCDI